MKKKNKFSKLLAVCFTLMAMSAKAQTISTIAGGWGDGGPATSAYTSPVDIAIDGSGNKYIADFNLHYIRKVSPSGVISIFAGSGNATATVYTGDGGQATAADIFPQAVAVDLMGNVYIADGNFNAIRKVNTSGVINTVAGNGTSGFSGDGGPATAAQLNLPLGMSVDGFGNLYFADCFNNVIRKVSPLGIIKTVVGNNTEGYSGDGGPATAAALDHPEYVSFDAFGRMYIADYLNNAIRKVTLTGVISTIAGNGTAAFAGDGGPATAAELNQPVSVKPDGFGNIFISDAGNYRVRKINSAGVISTFAGNGTYNFSGDGGPATAAQLSAFCIYFDGYGNAYIADYYNERIRKVNTSGIISTFAGCSYGAPGYPLSDGGPAVEAMLAPALFSKVAIDGSGNVYIPDADPNNIIRKVNTSGVISTFAGNRTAGYSGDGGLATTAEFYLPVPYPTGAAVDVYGNVYVADIGNNVIRKINTSGIVSTFAGTGAFGNSGDGGPATAAELSFATGVATDANGNVYIADAGNNVIRKVNSAGVISTVAGNGTPAFGGDGSLATAAQLNLPWYVAIDESGNLYIADYGNNRIRKVSTSGIINTVAGNGSYGEGGNGGPATAAEFYSINDVAVDASGNLYIGDYGSQVIRKVNTSGIISIYAGVADSYGFSGDGGPATSARMYFPQNVTVDSLGNLYIACSGDSRVRKVKPLVYSITGHNSVCVGGTTDLNDPTAGGTWSSSNPGIATVNTGTGLVKGISGGIATITYTHAGNYVSRKITVNTPPNAGAITGPSIVSVGSAITLSDAANGGVWSSSNTGIGTVGMATGIVTGIAADIVAISYSVTNSCGTASARATVYVTTTGCGGGDGKVCMCHRGATISVLPADIAGHLAHGDYLGGCHSGCERTTNPENVVITATPAMKIYPNPSDGTFSVEIPSEYTNADIMITDVTGKVIELKTISDNDGSPVQFNLTGMAQGTYMVQVNAGGEILKEKLTVK